MGSTQPGALGSPKTQRVGLSGSVHWRSLGPVGWSGSIGLTPTGGAVAPTWTADIGWRDIGTDHDWRIALQRQPVDDSVLSLTGLRDPATGRAWGRVMRSGLSAGGYQTLWPQWNGSAQLRLARLSGQHVASNDEVSASVALTRDLALPGLRFLSVGPAVAYQHDSRNLSGFTWGQGGYFSPQHYTSVGLQAVFQTQDARPWVLAGQLQSGWQSVQQDASACFALPPPLAVPPCAPAAASRSSGLGSGTALQGIALLSPHWAVEASAQLRTGPAYQDRSVYLGLRYFFSTRRALYGSDLPPAVK